MSKARDLANFDDAWQSWAPALGTSWANGSGTWNAVYKQIGKTVHVQAEFTLATNSIPTGGASGLSCSLPVTAKVGQFQGFVVYGSRGFVHILTGSITATTSFVIWASSVGGTYPTVLLPSASVPFAWAAGDKISFAFTYEAA